ncbi:endonuclease/exonuclease/phosphatase family protein [Agrococcus sp. SGAir0287]|uniref:endonuclease/exonuclease/phosphatase family protein n=1 Tax=Agrococcus sp. SGAir0287 TaxID=2070347 RepID=UPI0010CD484A|nr:endonuclease/exonuclease/phosphatase family protein [Agrococcus sp. SGAir0287]QCR18877.1 endonuclease/exonuclease/phosphatase family protein [Agrococcus sp. SGAir0287]
MKVLGWLLGIAVAAALLVAAWPQTFGLEQAPIVAQVVSLRMGVVAIAAGLTVLFLLLMTARRIRRFAGAVVVMLLVFMVASSGIHLSRGVDDAPVQAAEGDLVVVTWNTLGDAPGADEIAGLLRDTGADVAMLPETTIETGTRVAEILGAEGNPFWAITTDFANSEYGALNTTLLVSAALGSYTAQPSVDVGQTNTLPTVVATPDDGSGPVLVATHPVAPIPQQMRNWRDDLAYVASLCAQGRSIIVGGDFNSTLDHWTSLGVGSGDIGTCVDAAGATGAGAIGTWPTWAPAWLGAQIDHVVASADWRPIAAQVLTGYDDLGTDHRPVVAVLRQG